MRLLFVSPCPFGGLGGIQLSSQLAWDGIVACSMGSAAELLCYGSPACHHASDNGKIHCSASRLGVSLKAVTIGRKDVILIWHIGMLKLLPFLRSRGSAVMLFLHGIECWRAIDRFTNVLLEKVDVFLSNSDFTWRRFVEHNPRWKSAAHYLVPLGAGDPIPAAAVPTSPPAALIVARMLQSEDYKGHRQLIEAWPAVLKRIPAAELWICGDGDLRPDLEGLAKSLSVDSRVRFLGEVSGRRKHDLLEQCRCLAMPSCGEGFGIAYIEAMRYGRPCLVSASDAGREVVNPPEAGLCADPKNVPEFATALCRLLSPGAEWDEWSSAARRRHQSYYTASQFQERLIGVLAKTGREACVGA